MTYIVDTRAALNEGVPHETILIKAEKYLKLRYHQYYSNWDYREYPLLIEGMPGDMTGIKIGSVEERLSDGWILINWHDIEPDMTVDKERDTLTKVFNVDQEYKEELL